MANYKGTSSITIAGCTYNVAGTIRHLTEQTAGDTAADAMYRNSVVYQVPTGKVFWPIGIRVYLDATGGGNIVVYSGDTEDAETAALRTIDLPASTVAGHLHEQLFNGTSVASAKFITINPSGTQVLWTEIIGYEI